MPLNLTPEQKSEIERRIHRSGAAQRVFSGADGELILDELKKFCNGESMLADEKNPNPYLLAMRAGKRDVWQFIQNLLKEDSNKAIEKLKELSNVNAE